MKIFFTLSPLLGIAAAVGRTTAPSGALVVGDSGDYSTIQDAVDALSTSSSEEQVIFIQPGTYKEQVFIDALSGPLTIYGSTSDTSSYSSNEVIITAGESQETQSSNDLTATLRVHTSDFKLYNVDVVNSYGQGSQALALSAYAEVRSRHTYAKVKKDRELTFKLHDRIKVIMPVLLPGMFRLLSPTPEARC